MARTISKRLERHSRRYFDCVIKKLAEGDPELETELCTIDDEFINEVRKLPKDQQLELMEKVEDQDEIIAALEKAEFEASLIADLTEGRQDLSEETGWYYPDTDIPYKSL